MPRRLKNVCFTSYGLYRSSAPGSSSGSPRQGVYLGTTFREFTPGGTHTSGGNNKVVQRGTHGKKEGSKND